MNYIRTLCRHKGAINILKYKKGTKLNSKGNLQLSLFENWLKTCVDIVKRRCTNGQQIGTKVLGNNHLENGNQICSERSSHLLCWAYHQSWISANKEQSYPLYKIVKVEIGKTAIENTVHVSPDINVKTSMHFSCICTGFISQSPKVSAPKISEFPHWLRHHLQYPS